MPQCMRFFCKKRDWIKRNTNMILDDEFNEKVHLSIIWTEPSERIKKKFKLERQVLKVKASHDRFRKMFRHVSTSRSTYRLLNKCQHEKGCCHVLSWNPCRYTEIIVRGVNVRTGSQTRPNMPVLKKMKTKKKKPDTKWNHLC